MNIHEYQAKELYRKYGIPVPDGQVVLDPSKARPVAEDLIKRTGNETLVVKAQIHAGGRGKAGGVKVVKGADAAEAAAKELFGKTLVTHQTGPEGKVVQRLLIEQGLDIKRELYLALVVDRETRRVAVMASSEGGVEIEEVAEKSPEKIFRAFIDPVTGLLPYQSRQLGFALGLEGAAFKSFGKLLAKMSDVFVKEDCSIVEINPLIVSGAGDVLALDAKVNFDENAAFRHPVWSELRDLSEEAETEIEAQSAGLSYIQLDGNIGCLVNGAGLAMATMDIIKHFGGEPANFLDVGGGATQEAVTKAFEIILKADSVKGIFVNIFGGIMRCDIIAEGILGATKTLGLKVPLVVRLEGTNAEEGKKILAESGLAVEPVSTMSEGAERIVKAVKAA